MTKKALGTLAAATACLLPLSGAWSQQTEALEEVIVTASRRAEALKDVPVSITAVDPAQFAAGGLTTLEDVVNYTPGVNFQEGGSPGRQTISMRGVSQELGTPVVGMYLDDIPLGSGTQWGQASLQMPDLVKINLERIEIIKGPQGTLYGASSMGGVVRYITKDPSVGDLSADVSVDLSSTQEGGFNHLASAALNIPLSKDRIGISLSGFDERNEGFIDRSTLSVDGARKNTDAADSFGGIAKLVAHLSERFTGTLTYAHHETQYQGLNSVNLGPAPQLRPVAGPYASLQGAQDSSTALQILGATLSYDFDWATLLSSSSYQEVEFETSSEQIINFGPVFEFVLGFPPGAVTSVPDVQTVKSHRFVQELRLTSPSTKSFEWILGAYYSDERSTQREDITGQPVNFTLLDYVLPADGKETAIFGDATHYFTPDFDITAGIRVARVETGTQLTNDGLQAFLPSLERTTSDDTIETYLLALRYRLSPEHSLYARVASGYRPASANLVFRDGAGNPAGEPFIGTDTLWSYELGAKGNVGEGAVSYDVAAWYQKWKDPQAQVFVSGFNTGGNANSDVTAYGVEGTLALRPVRNWLLTAAAAYTNSEIDDDETAAFGALAGENMHFIPQWAASFNTEYSFQVAGKWDAFVGAGLRYIGERDTGFEGGTGRNGATITPIIPNIPLDDYLVTDARAGITVGKVTTSLYVNNAFDEYGYTNGLARPVPGGSVNSATVLRPRTVGVVVTAKF